ncbi:hypothetical protein VTJ49DRAFT_259 [Mycothermus thermophilus]|uniref:Uncharacterized protein n=1 Tax=Humicola insolens TaxID=85995 RepID=A0ABR3VFY0_HUMIN
MGASLSTLVGWTVVIGCVYLVVFGIPGQRKGRDTLRGSQRHRLEEKKETRKEPKEKAKRQKAEPKSRDADASQQKAKPSKPAAVTSHAVDTSSEDDIDNREFARQLANVKQGTTLNGPKKSDEKRQKSVKQSRAQILSDDDDKADRPKSSAPSSTAGVDADDDTSAAASPEVKAADASGVADMLEPKAPGPSVLRLTDTEKAKQKKQKKAKEPEKTETKKQRQNRQKAEAAKALREENEKQRKADLEAQRRQARIAEGRPAKDGSTFVAQQQSAWTAGANATNGSPSTNGDFQPVQPLDTFSTSSYTDISVPKEKESSSAAPVAKQPNPADSWIATLPSEEEQLEMLRKEEAWSTVTSKKPKKKAAKEAAAAAAAASAAEDSEPTPAAKPAPAVKAAPAPAPVSANTVSAAPKRTASNNAFKSSFAALSTNEPEGEEENEWDV